MTTGKLRHATPCLLAVWMAAMPCLAAPSGPTLTFIYGYLFIDHGGLLLLPDGSLCGTTARGPAQGSVYQLVPPSTPGGAWTKRVLLTFSGANGSAPQSQLAVDTRGNLYGSFTQGAGAGHHGGIFQLQPPATAGGTWTENILHIFTGTPDGSVPAGKLVVGPNGTLYGVTTFGGTGNLGTVFQLVPPATGGGTWTESVLYSFGTHRHDGAGPLSGLVMDNNGNLYGTNEGVLGGSSSGTVFELSPPAVAGGAWTESILLQGSVRVGSEPVGALTIDGSGNLYGTAFTGGITRNCAAGCGTVFQLTPPATPLGSWTANVLYYFKGLHQAAQPYAGVLIGPKGTLFGTTEFGGDSNMGTVYWLTPPTQPGGAWKETVISFGVDNEYPLSGLVFGPNGVLYGNSQNAIFEVVR